MMEFVATTSAGGSVTLGSPVRFSHTANAYSVVSRLEGVFFLPAQEEVLTQLNAYLDGERFFFGDIARQTRTLGQTGRFLELSCTGFAGRMLQNQVQPRLLTNYTSNQLYADYAAPYGTTGNDLPYLETVASLEVAPGMTAWNVIDVFCRQTYGYVPKLTRDGRLTITLLFDEVHTISNDPAQRAHRYTSIKVHDRRDELISKVHIKADNQNEYDYSGQVSSSFTAKYGIRRERFYKPPKAWKQMPETAAYELIRNSGVRSLEVELLLPELVWMHPGDFIEFQDDFFYRRDYYVGESTMSCDARGYLTAVKLWDSFRG